MYADAGLEVTSHQSWKLFAYWMTQDVMPVPPGLNDDERTRLRALWKRARKTVRSRGLYRRRASPSPVHTKAASLQTTNGPG
jgi:hypothetical protein